MASRIERLTPDPLRSALWIDSAPSPGRSTYGVRAVSASGVASPVIASERDPLLLMRRCRCSCLSRRGSGSTSDREIRGEQIGCRAVGTDSAARPGDGRLPRTATPSEARKAEEPGAGSDVIVDLSMAFRVPQLVRANMKEITGEARPPACHLSSLSCSHPSPHGFAHVCPCSSNSSLYATKLRSINREIPHPRLRPTDRVLWAWLSRVWPGWQQTLCTSSSPAR